MNQSKVRETSLHYLRQLVQSQDIAPPQSLRLGGGWTAEIRIFSSGNLLGQGSSQNRVLSEALRGAGTAAIQAARQGSGTDLSEARFWVSLKNRKAAVGFVEFEGKALEFEGGRVVVRHYDAQSLRESILEQKNYLLKAAHPELFGYFKKYDADTDIAETRLRTIYTASSLFTLLKLNQIEPDSVLESRIVPTANFLLSMQVQEGPLRGAFHYSMEPATGIEEERFVVGTASKTIFTLLKLYEKTQDRVYLTAAENAGNWLLQLVDSEGFVTSEMKRTSKGMTPSRKKSYLYSGQVLSALSRLYAATKKSVYYETAKKLADQMLLGAQKAHYFVGDDFRKPNTISTSWVVMSLIDFALVDSSPEYAAALFLATDELLKHQMSESCGPADAGRFDDTTASSGNGWINEVLVEVYHLCRDRGREGCGRYKESSVKTVRWLLQNQYTAENSFDLPNPERVRGGMIRNAFEKSVRTDAVCHGANGLAGLLEIDPEIQLDLP